MEVERWCYDSSFQRIQIYYLIKHIGHSYGKQLAGGWMIFFHYLRLGLCLKTNLSLLFLVLWFKSLFWKIIGYCSECLETTSSMGNGFRLEE